ncbi:MAG: hypothetical protein J6X40_05310 [Bacteroidales bacterium]|nr:hypothetical protein [Bacteroidales bacterium]
MKKIAFIAAMMLMVFGMASCGGSDNGGSEGGDSQSYKNFIGVWGVEKLEYWEYNIDYAGNPIAASYEKTGEFEYDVNDPGYGIQLVYNSDKTGEYRDFAIDSIWFKWNEELQDYDVYLVRPDGGFDSVIYCPDTTLVNQYTYLYDADDMDLYMNMDYLRTFKMHIVELTDNTFVSENRYQQDQATHTEKLERFFMKKVGPAPKSVAKGGQSRHNRVPHLSQELFH